MVLVAEDSFGFPPRFSSLIHYMDTHYCVFVEKAAINVA